MLPKRCRKVALHAKRSALTAQRATRIPTRTSLLEHSPLGACAPTVTISCTLCTATEIVTSVGTIFRKHRSESTVQTAP